MTKEQKARAAVAFPLPLVVTLAECDDKDSDQFVFVQPFETHGSWGVTRTEPGETTDFDSTPWWVRWLIRFSNRMRRAAVPHDHHYRKGDVPRIVADARFYEAMTLSGVPDWIRDIVYEAVRLHGRSSYMGPAHWAD